MTLSQARVFKTESGAFRLDIPCDDGTGGVLRIVQGNDGDLHFSMQYDTTQPNAIEEVPDTGPSIYLCNVRIRSWQGGGSNPELYLALAKALRKFVAQHPHPPEGTRRA